MASPESWYFLENGRRAPAWNMACDEWLLSRATWLARPVLRTYAWDRACATIGYFQSFPEDLAASRVVVRRPTGGAMVIHDADLTFTIVLPPGHAWRRLTVVERYARIHERVARVFGRRGLSPALADPFSPTGSARERHGGADACFAKASRHDVMVGGVKVAGGAQRVTKDGLLHQGSIQGGGHWRVSPEELRLAWESFDARFTGLRMEDDEEKAVWELAERKYATDAWNRTRVSPGVTERGSSGDTAGGDRATR